MSSFHPHCLRATTRFSWCIRIVLDSQGHWRPTDHVMDKYAGRAASFVTADILREAERGMLSVMCRLGWRCLADSCDSNRRLSPSWGNANSVPKDVTCQF